LARDQAVSLARAKDDFLAGMSHELRTPLNAILGFSEVIRDRYFGIDDKAFDRYAIYSGDIHRSASHLLALIDDLLDTSRARAGQLQPATERLSVEEVFGAALRGTGRRLPIGSIKGNIGHTRETAGAAGLVKVIMAMEAGTLPPTGGLVTPTRSIPWNDVVARPQREAAPWRTQRLRRAGVSAFGIGGLDYHVVVEEPPPENRVFAVGPAEVPATAVVSRPLDVAIVGLGARLPGASTPAALWARVVADQPAIVEAPADRWSKAIFEDRGPARPYRTYTARGAFLEGFKADWRRYRVPPKLVDSNDPLQFMLLESASDALEDAGIDLVRLDRARVATVMGTTFGSDYALDLSLAIRAPELAEASANPTFSP
jgi:acyl transferase domain-containing protein